MKVTLCSIAPRSSSKSASVERLTSEYVQRANHYLTTETQSYPTEAALLTSLDKLLGRMPTHLILLDAQGKLFSSEDIAQHLGWLREAGKRHLILAIGPADGWSSLARDRADLLLSFGPITLPHELARLVLAEQIYRAFTILAGHPYHSGH